MKWDRYRAYNYTLIGLKKLILSKDESVEYEIYKTCFQKKFYVHRVTSIIDCAAPSGGRVFHDVKAYGPYDSWFTAGRFILTDTELSRKLMISNPVKNIVEEYTHKHRKSMVYLLHLSK